MPKIGSWHVITCYNQPNIGVFSATMGWNHHFLSRHASADALESAGEHPQSYRKSCFFLGTLIISAPFWYIIDHHLPLGTGLDPPINQPTTRKQDHPLEKIFTTTYHFPDAVIITPLAIKLRKETHPYSKSFPHSTNNTHFFSDFPASSQFSWTLPTKASKR